MQGKVVAITGANSGVGLETARALAADGATVVMTGRNPAKGAAAVDDVRRSTGHDDVHWVDLDLASFRSIAAGAQEILDRWNRLDVLVNNAGLILSERLVTEDGLEATFQINHLGHFLLVQLLRDRLAASAPARVVNVSSEAHRAAPRGLDFDDLQSEGSYRGLPVYAKSKLANILFTRELSRRLAGTGVTANALHPGTIASGFGRDGDVKGFFAVLLKVGAPLLTSPGDGADCQIFLARDPSVAEQSGLYFVKRKPRTPSRAGRDDDAAGRLWDESERLVVPAFASKTA